MHSLKTPDNRVLFQQFIANDILINKTLTVLEAHIPPQLDTDMSLSLFLHSDDNCDAELRLHMASVDGNLQLDIWEVDDVLEMDFGSVCPSCKPPKLFH